MSQNETLAKPVNGVPVTELFATIEAIKQAPAAAKFRFRVANEWLEGARTQSVAESFYGTGQEHVHARPFVLESDEPPVLLGKDLAPGAGEYLLHTLAACLTGSLIYHAAARGIQIEEVESTVEGDIDLQGFLGIDPNVRKGFQAIRVNFKLKADVPEEELQEIANLAPMFSPMFDSISRGVPISFSAERM
jgi:uncharacterized OsmC-like protein